jgi:hypothetical protein
MTPDPPSNPAGLSAIAYRTGTWATFQQSMLASLSSSNYPALAGLKTRDSDDFSIALLDASAVVLDILTFYQERLANESYLRTATQLDSLTQLSRLIGYRPSPGVAASTYLAFTLNTAPGLPVNPATDSITIPQGTSVQSVPGQGQQPQSFETAADIPAKPDWNALPVQTGVPWSPQTGDTSLYLAGVNAQLNPGDAILIVGDERTGDSTSNAWDFRTIATVTVDTANQRTLVTWLGGLGSSSRPPAQQNPRLFALRQRAALFGYNAPNANMLPAQTITNYGAAISATGSPASYAWVLGNDEVTGSSLASERFLDLDSIYSKVSPGSWIVLRAPSPSDEQVQLFYAQSADTVARSAYALSGKVTRLTALLSPASSNANQSATTTSLATFYAQSAATVAFGQSEELTADEQPLDQPLYGSAIDLEVVRQDLNNVTAVAVVGKSQKLSLNAGVGSLSFTPDDGNGPINLYPGDIVTLLAAPSIAATDTTPSWASQTASFTLSVADSTGRTGTITAPITGFSLISSLKSDPIVQELALVSNVQLVNTPFPHTRLVLGSPLVNCYDRTSTTVNANVAPANAGSSVTELVGSGSGSTPNQMFQLKQTPLTYTQASTPSGSVSTLQVTVNGAAWTEVPSLYNQPPNAQVFATMNQPGGKTTVLFGDGVEGALLPTGQSNLIANYAVGLGSAGNVGIASITTLVDRPLGVTGVSNPAPGTGGQDAQAVDDIRSCAPQSVLTLGRAVSITDYQNFASTFAGIAKANAIWIASGSARGVFLTIAGVDGASLTGSKTLTNLVTALTFYGVPGAPVQAFSFLETLFRISASVRYDPAFDSNAVNAAITTLLYDTYSFAARSFGQGVSSDEVAALLQTVPGVIAVNVTSVKVFATSAAGDLGTSYSVSAWNTWIAQKVHLQRAHAGAGRICPYLPVPRRHHPPKPAEILVLDPSPSGLTLGVMA